MVQPTVYVYDSETGEWVTPEELKRRQADRATVRRAVEDRVSALLQGAVIQFTLTGTVCGTTVTLSGTGVIAAVGTGPGLAEVGLVAQEARDPEGDPDSRSYDKLVELSERVNALSGQVVSLTERVTRLEEENKWLRQELAEIKGAVNEVRRNGWLILASTITVLVTVIIGLIVH